MGLLWLTSVSICPQWESWARGSRHECAGECHLESEPPPPPDLCLGGLSLGGLWVKVGVCLWAEGTATLPGLLNSTCTKSGGEAQPPPFQLPDGSKTSKVHATQAYLPPPPADPRLWAPPLTSSCSGTINRLESAKDDVWNPGSSSLGATGGQVL